MAWASRYKWPSMTTEVGLVSMRGVPNEAKINLKSGSKWILSVRL